ncbi:hypothetical protein NKH16_13125 [Mesorhizobium sp. M1307]|uniref:hypothetical protein n=1 Tax=unclassified Mesorhizobium TaxID=325217 RepID=UPI00333A0459
MGGPTYQRQIEFAAARFQVNFDKLTGPFRLYRQSMVAGIKPFFSIALVTLEALCSVSHPACSLLEALVHPARDMLDIKNPMANALPANDRRVPS